MTSTRQEIAGVARGGAISFVGAAFAALGGFVLTLVVSRGIGAAGAGVVFQAIAVFTIAFNVAKLGADTGMLWQLPRLASSRLAHESRRAVLAALGPVIAASAVAAVVVYAANDLIARGEGSYSAALRAMAPFLLVAAPMVVLLSATRGLGDVVPFTVVNNLALPALRPLVAGIVMLAGGGVIAVVYAWSAPMCVGLAIAAWIAWKQLHRIPAGEGTWTGWREFWRFTLPRGASAILEIVLVWADVLIVGALLGPAEAGIYAAASRFITSGTIAEQALRLTIAPRFSSLLSQGLHDRVQSLYGVSAAWIMLASWPIYVSLALYGDVVLGIFGAQFTAASTALAILAVGMMVALAAGNIQSLLLMSGKSTWQFANKVAAVTLNVTANLVLVPGYGINGAAIAWSVTMAFDAILTVVEVRRLVGVKPELTRLLRVAIPVVVCYLLVGLLARWLFEPSVLMVVGAVLVSTALYGLWCWRERRTFDLSMFKDVLMRRREA
jgi:O-antigen/teichoic acid export membrane protein